MNDVPRTSSRLWARLIDSVLILAFTGFCAGSEILDYVGSDRWWYSWPFLAGLILVPICYESLSYWCCGRTFGKWVFGLRVVPTADRNAALSLGQCFSRGLGYQLCLFFSWAVVALAFFRPNRTHLADWIAGTRVISQSSGVASARVHWFWGFILVVLFAWSGWREAHFLFRNLVLRQGGISVSATER